VRIGPDPRWDETEYRTCAGSRFRQSATPVRVAAHKVCVGDTFSSKPRPRVPESSTHFKRPTEIRGSTTQSAGCRGVGAPLDGSRDRRGHRPSPRVLISVSCIRKRRAMQAGYRGSEVAPIASVRGALPGNERSSAERAPSSSRLRPAWRLRFCQYRRTKAGRTSTRPFRKDAA